MTRVSADITASLQSQPPRSKPVRDDAASPRDDFSTMIDDGTAHPAEPSRVATSDKKERTPRAANDRRDTASAADTDAKTAPKRDNAVADDATAAATSQVKTGKGKTDKTDTKNVDAATADTTKSDTAKTADAATSIATDTIAPATAAAVVTPQIVALVTPQPSAVAVPTAPSLATNAQSGPLSIAAAALATSAATVASANSAVAAGEAVATPAATPDTKLATTTAIAADPAIAAAITATATAKLKAATAKNSAEPTAATTDRPIADLTATTLTTPDAGKPVATPSASPTATKADAATTTETKPDGTVKAADGTKPDTTITATPREHHALVQSTIADAATPSITPTPSITQSTTSVAAPVPQMTVVASQTAPVPLNGLAMQIAATAASGKTSFEIRLDPAELGRIDVRLDVDRHGNVTSHLTVEKAETLSMLRQDAPQLQRALNDAGLQTSDKSMQFSLSDQSLSGQNNNQNSNQNGRNENNSAMQRLVIADDDNMSLASVGRSYGRMLASSSGVDISV